jgi:hypothetical protein
VKILSISFVHLAEKYSAMKLLYLSFFITIFLFSCNINKPAVPENKQAESPKALQEDNSISGGSLLSKRSYRDDLVEDLYNELLEKNSALSELEHGMDKLKEDKKDSAESFNAFNLKNNSYYNSADTHIGAITDSVLKQRIKLLVDNSLSKYKSAITGHNNLIAAISSKDITLNDLHIILKLTQTLSMIEKYQVNRLPPTKPLENTSKNYDKIITQTDSLSKK